MEFWYSNMTEDSSLLLPCDSQLSIDGLKKTRLFSGLKTHTKIIRETRTLKSIRE